MSPAAVACLRNVRRLLPTGSFIAFSKKKGARGEPLYRSATNALVQAGRAIAPGSRAYDRKHRAIRKLK
jgi:hypothetical protein